MNLLFLNFFSTNIQQFIFKQLFSFIYPEKSIAQVHWFLLQKN